MQSTEELVKAVLVGEKSAFSHLVVLYERAAVITAYSVLHDHQRAQDAAQDGFVSAYTKLHQLSASAAFGPWLLKIVRRRASRMRREYREERLASDVPDSNAEQTSDGLNRYDEVLELLERLPEHERIVIVMRYVNGYTPQEIADTTGKAVGTIKKQLSRALARLRKWLREVPS